MALVVDNRAAIPGPGVHALVVGVSDYANLPDHDDPPVEPKWFLNKLTSGAVSAHAIYELLARNELRLPVKTIRLLLSPHPVELARNPALENLGASRATRAAFEQTALEWREDAKNEKDSITIFYFAGHGLQRGPEEGVGLLEDFLAPGAPLARCFEVGDLKNGMAPSDTFQNIASTQFYFMDACLTRPETQKKFVDPQVPDVFGAELNVVDYREAPLMFSTVDGAISLGREARPSHFAEALRLALQNAAEDPVENDAGATVWPITSLTIKNSLDLYYAKHKLGTKVKMNGVVGLPVIRYLNEAPEVAMSIKVQPDTLGPPYGLWLYDGNDTAVPQCAPSDKTHVELTLKAGIYRVQVEAGRLQASPYRSQPRLITQRGTWPWVHNLANLLRP